MGSGGDRGGFASARRVAAPHRQRGGSVSASGGDRRRARPEPRRIRSPTGRRSSGFTTCCCRCGRALRRLSPARSPSPNPTGRQWDLLRWTGSRPISGGTPSAANCWPGKAGTPRPLPRPGHHSPIRSVHRKGDTGNGSWPNGRPNAVRLCRAFTQVASPRRVQVLDRGQQSPVLSGRRQRRPA